MDGVTEFRNRMRRLEALACPTPADIPFFNAHIHDLGQASTYRDNLENIVRLRSSGSD